MAETLLLDFHAAMSWVRQAVCRTSLREVVRYEGRYSVKKAAERRLRVLEKRKAHGS